MAVEREKESLRFVVAVMGNTSEQLKELEKPSMSVGLSVVKKSVKERAPQ